MPIDESSRLRFHRWLLQHDLDEQVADAILASMPPYDWHELATKADLQALEHRIDHRFELIEMRLDHHSERFAGIDKRLDGFDTRLAGMAQEIRAVLFTLIGLTVSVLLAGASTLFG